MTVIDGPYTSLYGPGFAFLAADLLPARAMPTAPRPTRKHVSIWDQCPNPYTRENVLVGGQDWGMCVSYGLREGNDYLTGGSHPESSPVAVSEMGRPVHA